MLNDNGLTIIINLSYGYACRADKNPYRYSRRADKKQHERHAGKNLYRHNRRADSQCPFLGIKFLLS